MNRLVIIALLMLTACRGTVQAVNEKEVIDAYGEKYVPITKELSDSLQTICDTYSNPSRQTKIKELLDSVKIAYTTEIVDWWMPLQDNIIVNIPGKTDRIFYITAHSDKIDGCLHGTMAGQLSSGLTDNLSSPFFMSDGAIDNGVGCATILQFAKHLKGLSEKGKLVHSYRIVFFGGEEVGLKGSRSHVARLNSEEWSKIDLVINLDCAGASRDHFYVPSNKYLNDRLQELVKRDGNKLDFLIPVKTGWMIPFITTSDHASFHGTSCIEDLMFGCFVHNIGGILPSMSWFTGIKTSKPTLFLSSDFPNDSIWFALLCNIAMIPVSELHGCRDSLGSVDPIGQLESFIILRNICYLLDAEEKFNDD